MKPVFNITADNRDAANAIRQRFSSLSLSDEAGYESDQLTIVLSDAPDPITGARMELPRKGVLLSVSLGYETTAGARVFPAGRWVVDEVEPSGGLSGDIITITANGSDTSARIKETRTRSFKNISLYDVMRTIGENHHLKPRIAEAFKQVHFDQLDQTAESDLNLITRLAADHDALGKLVGDILVFTQRNTGINADGKKLSPVKLSHPGNISTWRMSAPSREKYSKVVAKWYDVGTGQQYTETAGEGEPVLNIEKIHPDASSAREAAQAKLKQSDRTGETLTLTGVVPDDSLLLSETPISVEGLRPGVDGHWRVDKQQLSLGGSGFTFSLTAVRVA